jgi:hypothetical protein
MDQISEMVIVILLRQVKRKPVKRQVITFAVALRHCHNSRLANFLGLTCYVENQPIYPAFADCQPQ